MPTIDTQGAAIDMDRVRAMSPEDRRQLLALLRELERRRSRNVIASMFPDTGPMRRELYPKHLGFFAGGSHYRERTFMAGNRVGKTMAGGYEAVCHLTGNYPDWWEGRRFDGPIEAMVAGETFPLCRDTVQAKMVGPLTNPGTGLIPADSIISLIRHPQVREMLDSVTVRHVSGGVSRLMFRSYDQGARIFQGFELHLFWPDEECPASVYAEGITRTATTGGIVYSTFTPLRGLTPLIQSVRARSDTDHRDRQSSSLVVTATWDDVPHLSTKAKAEMLAAYPAFQRDARSKGVPSLGAGAIYPVDEEEFVIDPLDLPKHWPRAYGLDVGWRRTAAIWGALDPDTDVLYLYSEHYRGQVEPSVHVAGINARGKWIRGAIDPAANASGQMDGTKIMQVFIGLGLKLSKADNAVSAGLYAVMERLSSGRLKVFRTCTNWIEEQRIYRRNEAGNIVKESDHLMDATRYLVMSWQDVAQQAPAPRPASDYIVSHAVRDKIAGY